MGENKTNPSAENAFSAPEQPAVTPGMNALLKGKQAQENAFPPIEKPIVPGSNKSKPLLPAWYFFAADIVLVGFALLVAFRSPGPLDVKRGIFCAVAVGLGAALSVFGVLQGDETPEK